MRLRREWRAARDFLVAAELVDHDNVAGPEGWHQHLFESARNLSPLIGPSITQAALMRSWRSATRNVNIRQRTRSALATSRSLGRVRPWPSACWSWPKW